MRESKYEKALKQRISALLPGCVVKKNNPNDFHQGVPDLLILYGSRWAMLEVKASDSEPFQPNQEHYISHYDNMSYAAVIHPGNEEQVLHGLQQALTS